MGRFVLVIAALAAGCQFRPLSVRGDAGPGGPKVDAPRAIDATAPITCGQLHCDPNATCTTTGSGATCTCNGGYDGDGTTCTAVDPCATNNGGCAAACVMTGPGTASCYTPQSCADVAAHTTLADDSNVTLYFSGDPSKPWTAFCHGGLEYLALPAGAANNYGQYSAGGASDGSDVRTSYTKVRLDPATAKLDISDQTFATSTGMLQHGGSSTEVTSMPLGIAMDCVADGSHTGVASIDLTGTPFALTTNWATGGAHVGGSAMKSSANQKIAITGGGYCGWDAPTGAPQNPFNMLANGELVVVGYP